MIIINSILVEESLSRFRFAIRNSVLLLLITDSLYVSSLALLKILDNT